MQLPEPGEFVRIRDERWRVLRCEAHAACAAIDVAPLADHATRATFLLPFDRLERLPAATQPRRVGPGEWRRIARRALADARPHWWSLRCATGAQISLLPFQLEPAIALARGHATRVLIADAVGLGKTIQAGLAIAETLERTPSAHVLVVCPAALRSQWQEELSERFALHAQVLDAPAIAAAEDAVPAGINPWTAAPLLITSIDFVKRPDVIRSLEPVVWDLAVFDEAHALAGRSDRATAAAALARRARAVVMLTATPHSGDDEAFSRLSALGRLEGDPPLATFRRTAAILGSRPRRRTTTLRVRPTRAERQVHEALDAYCALAWSATPRSAGGQLALMVLRRRAASSPASLARSVTRRIALLETTTPPAPPQLTLPFDRTAEDDDEPAAELEAPALADRAVELDLLRNLLALANACGCESKIRALLRLLTRAGEPAIVFTQYRDTLQTLAAAAGSAAPQLHGGMTLRERHAAARRFTHGQERLLLATDAASEGLNLHRRCRLVINLELPWTPARLEQRVGRVDRLGQERRVHAVHLVAAQTEEEEVVARHHDRSERIENAVIRSTAVGDAAREECERIALARTLAERSAAHLPARPVVARVRSRRGGAGTLSVFRVPVADESGLVWWEWIVGCDAAVARCATAIDPAPMFAAVRQAIADAAAVRATRERALADNARRLHARISAPLRQRGLFERRNEQQASAQTRVLAAVLAATDAHLAALVRLAASTAEAPRPIFTLVRRWR